ncbi:MAG TPA: PA2169 family four-helix-bundle protein [Candidatus Udaeobacter sp.]
MKKENEVIDCLIETLKDGQEGFKQAAEGVSDPKLKSLFLDYSQQRSRFAAALQSEARRHGENEPETSSSAAGALHRGWINLKSAITGGDEHTILAECERGEDSAVEEYKKALENGLTPAAQELVSRQFAEIKAAHDRIKSLRDATNT